MCKFIRKSNERILCKLNKREILRLYSIVHVAMETTKTSNFSCQSKSFISIFFTRQVSACELQPFSCHYLANNIHSQTAKTVFSHLNYPAFPLGRDGYSSGLGFLLVDVPPFALWSECVNWRNITWSIFDKFIGLEPKSAWYVVEIKQEKAVFCQSVGLTVLVCGLYDRSTIILVEIFSDMSCLEDIASWNCQTNTVARSV